MSRANPFRTLPRAILDFPTQLGLVIGLGSVLATAVYFAHDYAPALQAWLGALLENWRV